MKRKPQKIESEGKRTRCMLLLMIPVFFFSLYLYMGKRSKQSGYTKMGIFYGVSSLVTFIVSALGLVWPVFLYGIISHMIVWVLCTIHAFNCRHQYQQYEQWVQEDEKERSQLVHQESFRRRAKYWCFWDCIPLLGGLATYLIGKKIKKPGVKWFGILSTLAVIGLCFYLTMLPQITSGVFTVMCIVIAYSSLCIHPLLFGFYFEEYLDAEAKEWETLAEECPQIESGSWRFRNSIWQILTFAPFFGSLGLFWAGITRENGKVLTVASVLCILEVSCLAAPSAILQNAQLLAQQPIMENIAGGISAMWIFAYALIVFTGACIRREMLRIRAYQEMRF